MISLIIGISLLFKQEVKAETVINETEIIIASTTLDTPELYLREKAREYGLDEEMVVKIAKCESSLNPNVVSKTGDHGLLQINYSAHNLSMQAAGLDIYNAEDTVEYGLKLMKQQGVKPWKYSAHCHGYY